MGILTVLWEKWVEFRRDFYKITVSAMISPLMYLIIFGLGIQTTSHGEPYLHFLIPGIVAMATMTGSFGAIAQNMSVQQQQWKHEEQMAYYDKWNGNLVPQYVPLTAAGGIINLPAQKQ